MLLVSCVALCSGCQAVKGLIKSIAQIGEAAIDTPVALATNAVTDVKSVLPK